MNSTIDNSVSDAIKRSAQISLTKNFALPEENIGTTVVATRFENGNGKNTCVWPEHVYFKQQPCNFHIIKEKSPEKSFVDQSRIPTNQEHKTFYHADYYILGQINECINPPENIHNYVCKKREVRIYCPQYDPVARQILGLYESLGFIIVRADPDGNFLDYGFCKKKLKILYSYHEIRIPNSWFTEYIFCCLLFLAINY